ncbi:hypothetical protein OY671_008122, partial [Metschnikowia pulcherrima]
RTLIDASSGYRFNVGWRKPVESQVNATNSFDKRYVATIGSNGFGFSGDNQTSSAGAPRQGNMNFQTCSRAGSSAGTGALALAVSPAFAAEAAAPAADAASPETDSTGSTEIVVTATKRETNLQQTPISISVMGADDLKKRHVQSSMDLADGSVPSSRISTFEARQSASTIGIRGIVPDDANQPAREQGVGVYLDGVYLGRQ